jgi:ubiquinone/menaquinone biosynthesis C-methylase UbiE
MDNPHSNLSFKLMTLTFKLRDFFVPRINVLKEVRIKEGFGVLDYGCGAGSYISPLAELIGKSGKIYALDIHPLAVKMVQNLVAKKQLANVRIILSDCQTGLPDESLNVVLLYDVLHGLSELEKILKELHRVLKSDGILSVSDHHLKESIILYKITGGGWFKLLKKGKRTYNFLKNEQ